MTPEVSNPTAAICLVVYLFPLINHPIVMVTSVPPDRKIMYTGMETWYPNAALLSVEVMKNKVTINAQR